MSTETQLSASTHARTPSPAGRAATGRVGSHAADVAPARAGNGHRTGSFAIPTPSPVHPSENDSLSWDRATSDGLPVVAPRMRQLMGVCGWAAILGGLGLVIGIRGFIGDLMGKAPGWYEPAMIVVGIIGIGLTIGGFVTVQRRRMPYVMLGAATTVLLIALLLTINAF